MFVTRSIDKFFYRISTHGVILEVESRACDKNIDCFRAMRAETEVSEMATAQRTRPRAVVVGAPRRAASQLKSALRHSVSGAPRTIIFLHFFRIIAGDFFFMNNNS